MTSAPARACVLPPVRYNEKMFRALIIVALGLMFAYLSAAAMVVSKAQAPQPHIGGGDTLLVLGKRVSGTPDQDLVLRIQRLEVLLVEFPTRTAIASGSARTGQISEAAFVAQALPQYNITLEQRASTTRENLRHSIPLARPDAAIGVITNRYHLARTEVISRQKGLTLIFIPAEDVWEWSWPNIVSLAREAALYWPAWFGW